MPEPTKIPRPFADSGDKNSIPDSSGGLGFASWQEGFPAITGTPFAQGGVAPKRADFNGIFNALSLATLWQQQGGFYAYDATTDYEVGNVVEYNGDLYKCLTANGPSSAVKDPTDTTVWSKVMTSADTAALYLPLSGGAMSGDIANADKGFRRFLGGSSTSDGARLAVSHEDNPGYEGEFWLVARANGTEVGLIGKPNGSLKWDGKEILVDHGYESVASSAVAVSNSVRTFLKSYTFVNTGVYLVVYLVIFQSTSTTGIRSITVSATSAGTGVDDFSSVNGNPSIDGYTFIYLPKIEKITTANTVRYLNCTQKSGSPMNCVGEIRVVRLGDA